jgi:hypothetical protein
MSHPDYEHLFPIAMGTEEETMMSIGNLPQRTTAPPLDFSRHYTDYIPDGMAFVAETDSKRTFLQNGAMVYEAFSKREDVNFERVTPECADAGETALHIEALEKLLVRMLSKYVTTTAAEGRQRYFRVQRRVADAVGSTRGCHDNFQAVRPEGFMSLLHDGKSVGSIISYLATRTFITGAGQVNADGLYFSQKTQNVAAANGYGNANYAYRYVDDDDTGHRFEVRCNDVNISPWATQARIGGAALFMTLLQTPLAEQVGRFGYKEDNDGVRRHFRRFNHLELESSSDLKFSLDIQNAVDFQEQVVELMRKKLGNFVDLSPYYQGHLQELTTFIDDFRKVQRHQEPLSLLADRADYAAKFHIISRSITRDRENGQQRKMGDEKSRGFDFAYDLISISPPIADSDQAEVKYGYGYRLRDTGRFRSTFSAEDVRAALWHPPALTRALIRGELIRRKKLASCEWSTITMKGSEKSDELNNVLLAADYSARIIEASANIPKPIE